MVHNVHRLLVLLLTTSSIIAQVSKESCNINALIGSNLSISLDQRMPSNSKNTLRWTHNSTVIFYRTDGRVRLGMPTGVDAGGSLQLLNLSFSSAGVYKADVLNATGVRVNGWSGSVCVVEKVSTPVVTFLCGSSGATATLNCDVLNPRDVVFAWTHEGQLLKGETKPTLSVSLATFKGDKGFSCSVSNIASKDKSNAVWLKCEPPLPPPTKLYCFKASTVMATVMGGVGLILLLFIITVVTCYRRKKAPTPEDREELTMSPATKFLKSDSIPDYEIMHPSGDTPCPSPKLSPGPSSTVYGQDVVPSFAKAQEGLGPTSPEGKRGPSPVPKPRTNAPQAAKK